MALAVDQRVHPPVQERRPRAHRNQTTSTQEGDLTDCSKVLTRPVDKQPLMTNARKLAENNALDVCAPARERVGRSIGSLLTASAATNSILEVQIL